MKKCTEWKDYEVISTGNGEKLERWGDVILLRPDPQVIWPSKKPLEKEKGLAAKYIRESTGGGRWQTLKSFPEEWKISYKDLTFLIKPMGFKHTGLFPEQAYNWDKMRKILKDFPNAKVLNLFAYTGGATVACAAENAIVTHVDASRGMCQRAKDNLALSGLKDAKVRFLIDDCFKFVEREIRRGNKYDAIIMDPPSYGRGPGGEIWKLESDLYAFAERCKLILSDEPLFFLINSYTTGLQPTVLNNILSLLFERKKIESYELGLPCRDGLTLPCGASGFCSFKEVKND